MSQENVEVVRDAWKAWLRGDMASALAFNAPDVVWDTTHFSDWPEGDYTGSAEIQRFLGEWLDVWDAFEAGVEEILATQDGRVVALAWQRGRGRHSGLKMDMEWAQIFTLRDGKIIRIDNYDDRALALEAVGLSEQNAHADS